jgi:D-alanyl-D-alanine carboxypeptidase
VRPTLIVLLAGTALAWGQSQALPECRYDDLAATPNGYDAWNLTLLDTLYALDADYAPPDLIEVDAAGRSLRALVVADLEALLAAAEANGVPLAIQSAYRSHGYQAGTFDSWVDQLGLEAALRTSARPGHSEHQLGTAIDFRSADGPPAWDLDDWGATPAGAWLAENGWRYGFVMSYPAGREGETCYDYEPWHHRYLGRNAAAAQHTSGLTLRAWLWQQR